MVKDPRRRIGKLTMVVDMPGGISAKNRRRLENAGKLCPVLESLDKRIDVAVEFRYPD